MALLLVAVGASLVAPSAGAFSFTKLDPDDGDYLVGTLTWNGGRGSISWNGAASEDPAGPRTSPEEHVFVSEPLPRTLHINASRKLELDIFLVCPSGSNPENCSPSTNVQARLAADDVLVGGDDEAWFKQGVEFPGDPQGYNVMRIRIASEVGILSKGEILTLVLRQVSNSPGPYGMGEGHRSILRIPVFSDDEVPFRYPAYAHGRPGAAPSGIPGGGLLGLGALSLAVPAALAGRRLPRAGVLLVLLVLMAGLGGCVGQAETRSGRGASPGEAVATPTLSPDYLEPPRAAGERGSLAGQVIAADVSRAIAGANVALLGTPNSTKTDPYGRFIFKGLGAGTYHLRVDRDGFHPFEGQVAVLAGLIARVNITLSATGLADAGQRPHLHDYWEGRDTITLMDRVPLRFDCPSLLSCGGSWIFAIPVDTEKRLAILPGTYEVNVTASWDPQAIGYPAMALSFQANNDPSPDNGSTLLKRGPGEPFHIATTWEMGDAGHQKFSTWAFLLRGFGFIESDPTAGQLPTRQLAGDTIVVSMSIRRGTVPLEAAHPDRWAGRNELRIVDGVTKFDGVPMFAPPDTNHPMENDGVGHYNLAWLPAFIPPGTAWLEVFVNATAETVIPYEREFRFRTAKEGAPSVRCWSWDASVADDCDGPEYRRPGPGTVNGLSERWVIEVGADEADPFYVPRSLWVFGVRAEPDRVNLALSYANSWAGQNSARFTLTVIAHRDSTWTTGD